MKENDEWLSGVRLPFECKEGTQRREGGRRRGSEEALTYKEGEWSSGVRLRFFEYKCTPHSVEEGTQAWRREEALRAHEKPKLRSTTSQKNEKHVKMRMLC